MELLMNLKHYLTAGVMMSAAAFAGGTAYAAPCPNVNGVTTCNVVITAGPGGSFVTTVPNPNPYDGSDEGSPPSRWGPVTGPTPHSPTCRFGG